MPRSVSWNWIYDVLVTFLDARPPERPLTPLSPFCKMNPSVRWKYCWAESVPRKDSLQRNRSTLPVNTRWNTNRELAIIIALLDSPISQMTEWFAGEGHHARGLLCFVPSIELSSGVDPFENVEDMFHWESDLLNYPKISDKYLRRYQSLWQCKSEQQQIKEGQKSDTSVPSNLLAALGTCDVDPFTTFWWWDALC